jgi:hypothetical protein
VNGQTIAKGKGIKYIKVTLENGRDGIKNQSISKMYSVNITDEGLTRTPGKNADILKNVNEMLEEFRMVNSVNIWSLDGGCAEFIVQFLNKILQTHQYAVKDVAQLELGRGHQKR